MIFSTTKKTIARLEAENEFLKELLKDRTAEVKRLQQKNDENQSFWQREFAALASSFNSGNTKPPVDFREFAEKEPTKEEVEKAIFKSKQDYEDFAFWHEGDGIAYDPEGYKKDEVAA